MRIIILALLVFSFAKSQTLLSETFSNFIPDTAASNVIAAYITDETNYPGTGRTDHGPNGYDLLVGAAAGGQAQSSVLYDGGYSESFNNSGSWYIFGGAPLDLTGSFSVFASFYKDDVVGTEYLFCHDDGGANRQWGLYVNGNALRFHVFGGGTNGYRVNTITATTWYNFVGIYDSSGTPALTTYINGASAGANSGTIAAQLNSIAATATTMSGIANGTLDYSGELTALYLFEGVLTAQQCKELGYLANGWASLGGGVTRSSFAFHQGIVADTVYYATALAAGNWSITVNVDGAAGGESLLILTSADASTWSTLGTISVTTTATDYTVTGSGLGYVGFGLAGGTVYLDNVTVTLATATATKPKRRGFKRGGSWKTYTNR